MRRNKVKNNKVIFLDIDGVLTSSRCHYGTGENHGIGGVWSSFDPVAVQFLNYICREYGYDVVISSTWRNSHDASAMRAILTGNGCRFRLHNKWATSRLGGKRGGEIKEWFDHASADHYIIIDDDGDMLEEQMDFFVQTDGLEGMLIKAMHKLESLAEGQREKEKQNAKKL